MLDRAFGLIAAIAAAAMWIAVAPALAQTNDPNLSQQQIDCMNNAAGCADGAQPGDMSGAPSTGATVPVADLIVDLFPAPEGGGPSTDPGDQGAGPAAPPSDIGDNGVLTLPPSSGPVAAPAGLKVAEAPRAISGDFVPDEVLVTVDGGADIVQQLAAAFGLEVRSARRSLLLNATVARFGIPDGRPVGVVLAQLAADGRALRREPNHVYSLQQAGGAANYAFGRISLDERQANGANVRVGVIDTGIDDANPALNGVISASYDAMPGVAIEGRDHGTSVDGLIAGVGPFRGIAPGARIFHARAFEGGKSTMDVILSALDWVAGQDVRIINMSFVGPKNDLLGTACRNARALGIVLVAAAGNNGPKAPFGYPAAFDGVLAVTATDDRDGLMQQANRGAYVYISAPGVDMVAPIGGGSDLVTGTSFAAAIVSGAIANLFHQAPDRSADWIEKALAETAKDLGPKGRDTDFGFGLLDIAAAEAAR